MPERTDNNIPEPISAVPAAQPLATVPHRTFRRAGWKHYPRYFALAAFIFLDFGFITSSAPKFVSVLHSMDTHNLIRILFAYGLLLFCNLTMMPTIVLEANTVETSEDALIITSLLFGKRIGWTEITNVLTPVYLKFAIVRTKGFFYLINKRDIPDFNQLLQTIRTKTGLPSG